MDIYGHPYPDAEEALSERLDARVRAAQTDIDGRQPSVSWCLMIRIANRQVVSALWALPDSNQ